MTTDSATNGSTPPATQIEFVQYHQPPLIDGDYTITLTQTVKINGKQEQPLSTSRRFAVQGVRCSLDPSDVQSVFPPEGSLGEHAHVLPHVVLTRSTLPWQRPVDDDPAHRGLPWLALLLFHGAEAPTPTITTLDQLRQPSGAAPWWPGLPEEVGEDGSTKVTVIDVARSALSGMLPSAADLAYLAHVRRGTDDAGKLVGDELAVLIGNRLPASGTISTAHLVSLEERYRSGSFDFQGAAATDTVRLVSLRSWSFACVDEKQRFSRMLMNLDPYAGTGWTPDQATLHLAAGQRPAGG
jgi:hypothetical protein